MASEGKGEINMAGIEYYNNMVDTLLQKGRNCQEHMPFYYYLYNKLLNRFQCMGGLNFLSLSLPGIQTFVTLFHFDLSKALEDSYGGWLSAQIM